MIRRFCDKCGKEIEGPYYNVSFTRVDGEDQMPVNYLDMCDDCIGTKNKTSEKGNISEENNDN